MASIQAGIIANSAYHGTRLDVDHISSLMENMIGKWEHQTGKSRNELSQDMFFMSHETYSPKRGGSSAAEVSALRKTFGKSAGAIPIANTKGFTGHTMGVGVEDVVAVRCLQKGLLPPIPNLKEPDPDFADLNLSSGGSIKADYALRLAAGFGSQIVMALYKVESREENRIADIPKHRSWLQTVTGYVDPVVSIDKRTLRVVNRQSMDKRQNPKRESASAVYEEPAERFVAGPSSKSADEVRSRILSLLSNKTGYPAEMLQTDLDLEADLGIDTVKQAEFISEVRDAFGIPKIDGLKIANFPTIEHIIQFAAQHAAVPGGRTHESSGPHKTELDQPKMDAREEAQSRILELLSNKTGYPAEMLQPDLDLEADLGIDTVKQAELIAEVRELFNIPKVEGLKIADFPTITQIIDFVVERKQDAKTVEPTDLLNDSLGVETQENHHIELYETRLVNLPQPASIGFPDVDQVFVIGGGNGPAEELARELKRIGFAHVKALEETGLPDDCGAKKVGVINLLPMDQGQSSSRATFELYLSLASIFQEGPEFLGNLRFTGWGFRFQGPYRNRLFDRRRGRSYQSLFQRIPKSQGSFVGLAS